MRRERILIRLIIQGSVFAKGSKAVRSLARTEFCKTNLPDLSCVSKEMQQIGKKIL